MEAKGQETEINRVIELVEASEREKERKIHNENNNSSLNIEYYKWPRSSSVVHSSDTADNIIMSVKQIRVRCQMGFGIHDAGQVKHWN